MPSKRTAMTNCFRGRRALTSSWMVPLFFCGLALTCLSCETRWDLSTAEFACDSQESCAGGYRCEKGICVQEPDISPSADADSVGDVAGETEPGGSRDAGQVETEEAADLEAGDDRF